MFFLPFHVVPCQFLYIVPETGRNLFSCRPDSGDCWVVFHDRNRSIVRVAFGGFYQFMLVPFLPPHEKFAQLFRVMAELGRNLMADSSDSRNSFIVFHYFYPPKSSSGVSNLGVAKPNIALTRSI